MFYFDGLDFIIKIKTATAYFQCVRAHISTSPTYLTLIPPKVCSEWMGTY